MHLLCEQRLQQDYACVVSKDSRETMYLCCEQRLQQDYAFMLWAKNKVRLCIYVVSKDYAFILKE